MEKQTLCPICLMSGMVRICKPKDDAFFECPFCKCGIWPPEDDVDMIKDMRERNELSLKREGNNVYISCSLPEGVTPHGGGGSSSGKGKGNDRMKKKTTGRLNAELGI